jgi:hypothetical protein
MARSRKNLQFPALQAGQAIYVLERLIEDRRISPAEVSRYVAEMHREISELESRLQMLWTSAGRAPFSAAATSDRAVAYPPPPPPPPTAPPRTVGRLRRRSITPEQLASRQLQGRYLGLIRQIPASRRKQYQKTAKQKGREAAIRDLKTALNK